MEFDPTTITWVLDDDDLDHLLVALAECEEVVIDLETTGLNENAHGEQNGGVPGRIVLASLTLPLHGEQGDPTTWVLPLSHPDSPWLGTWRKVTRRLAETMRDEGVPIVNHHVKFDLRWINAHTGVDLTDQIAWDTKVSSHLLDENSSTKLKERAPQTFGVPRWDDFDLTYPGAAEDVPMFDLGLYAARDTYWTWRLAVNHRVRLGVGEHSFEPLSADEVEDARLGKLAVWVAMPTTATLGEMEQRGLHLDARWTREVLDENIAEAARIKKVLSDRYSALDADEATFSPTATWFREWADEAVKHGDLTVAELTPTGKPRWSKEVLTRQARQGSEVAQDLLDYRGLTKRNEYLSSWLSMQTKTGTIHSTYNDGSVVTGRLSSNSPNMQQVTKALKPAFVPREGHVFVDLDYSQIELRVAAFISRCEPMLDAFRRGDDLHRLLAAKITGKDPDDVLATERQAGKSANFGLLYGMGAYGFREYAETVYGVSFTIEEATDVHSAFFEMWDGIGTWHLRAAERARTTGQVVSPIGRVRRLPTIWDANEEYSSAAERAAINAPVQGFASDLMQIAAASIAGKVPGFDRVEGALLVGTVHDSILVEVPKDDWRRAASECRDRMLSVTQVLERLGCTLDVPLAAEVQVGSRWGLSDIGSLSAS